MDNAAKALASCGLYTTGRNNAAKALASCSLYTTDCDNAAKVMASFGLYTKAAIMQQKFCLAAKVLGNYMGGALVLQKRYE